MNFSRGLHQPAGDASSAIDAWNEMDPLRSAATTSGR